MGHDRSRSTNVARPTGAEVAEDPTRGLQVESTAVPGCPEGDGSGEPVRSPDPSLRYDGLTTPAAPTMMRSMFMTVIGLPPVVKVIVLFPFTTSASGIGTAIVPGL